MRLLPPATMVAPVSMSVVGSSEPQAESASGKTRAAHRKTGKIRIGFDINPLAGPLHRERIGPNRSARNALSAAYTGTRPGAQRRLPPGKALVWLMIEGLKAQVAKG